MAWRHALLGLAFVLAACSAPEQAATPTAVPPPTEAAVPPTSVPSRREDTVTAFLAAWQQGQYSAMYDLLSAGAQASTPRDLFVRRYTNIHDGIGETKLTAQRTGPATATDPSNSQVAFEVTHSLSVFGDVAETN